MLIVLALNYTKSELTNFNYPEHKPHKQQPSLSNLLGFGIIKASSSTISPYLMKTNP